MTIHKYIVIDGEGSRNYIAKFAHKKLFSGKKRDNLPQIIMKLWIHFFISYNSTIGLKPNQKI